MKKAILALRGFETLPTAADGQYLRLHHSGRRPLDRRHVLDSILPDRPLALMSPDHHTVWANTIALTKAAFSKAASFRRQRDRHGEDGLAQGSCVNTMRLTMSSLSAPMAAAMCWASARAPSRKG